MENNPYTIQRDSIDLFKEYIESRKLEQRSLTEIVPENRNFDITFDYEVAGKPQAQIILTHKESGRQRNLGDFLPPQHTFVNDSYWYYWPQRRRVGFVEGDVNYRTFLLDLFHEIGHSHQETNAYSITRIDKIKAMGQRIATLIRKYPSNYSVLHRAMSADLLSKMYYPYDFIYKKSKAMSIEERGSWAYALNTLRRLNQEGFNVFAGFERKSEIRKYLAIVLMSYEQGYILESVLSSDKKSMQKIIETARSGLFMSRKYTSAVNRTNREPSA